MKPKHQPTSENAGHSDSISELQTHKISHTRRWIEFSLVIVVVAVLAIIVIPTITTISRSADYTTAFGHSKDIIGAFEVSNADAQYHAVAVPETATFTNDSILQPADSPYDAFIAERLKTYLPELEQFEFTFQLIKTADILVLYYWNTAQQAVFPAETGYRVPDYVYYVKNNDTKMVSYEEFLQSGLLPALPPAVFF